MTNETITISQERYRRLLKYKELAETYLSANFVDLLILKSTSVVFVGKMILILKDM